MLLGNDDRDRTRALAAISTAYRHRGRLTEMERLLTEGYYYTRGPKPDHDRALAAYEEAIRLDSTTLSALNNAAVVYGQSATTSGPRCCIARRWQCPGASAGRFST